MQFVCQECGKTAPLDTRKSHCTCGGLWNLDYKPQSFSLQKIDKDEWSMFRYREFMPLLDDTWRSISLGEGMTPIVPFDDKVMVKMDYMMPSLSFKDRGAAILVAHCASIGVDRVVQDSSGNAGNAVAAYCARAGIDCEIFVKEGTSPKKIELIRSHGARVNIIEGDRDHCAEVCRDKVEREGVYYANHVYNPLFYEGTKTYIYETYEQLHRIPQHLVIPVGNGTLFIGVVKALEHLLESGCIDEFPHIIALQSEYCDPLLAALRQGLDEPAKIEPKETMAEGIAIGKPMRGKEILSYARMYNIDFVHAPEDAILAAREQIAKKGIYCEHTTAANYAAYLEYCRSNGAIDDCLITMCGAGLKSDH